MLSKKNKLNKINSYMVTMAIFTEKNKGKDIKTD